ncbi:hypothetical protein MRB53_030664 [Persea americana]|uniref:Uncharacterized protein n=1 Tax=Persea americana TaxID=3435 RepID=A0ACC2KMB0_PERAE|nr:hypothetical protein MRB53_030664 [Persea americana]
MPIVDGYADMFNRIRNAHHRMGEDPTNLVKAREDLVVYVIEIKLVTRNFRALNEIPPIRVSNSSSRVTTSLRRLLAVVAHSPFANFNCRRGADHDNSEGDSNSEARLAISRFEVDSFEIPVASGSRPSFVRRSFANVKPS